MAAEHLLERKFPHYAFVGVANQVWSDRRQRSFCERIAAAGFQPHIYRPPRRERCNIWDREQAILADWLKKLPKPLGVMACDDNRGREILEACQAAHILVPEQIAVVGVDNDELLCELSDPTLSSVALNAELGGYRAAALLDKMMRGSVRKSKRLLVEPLHVVARRSSDILAIEDAEVAASLRFIQNHAAAPIGIDDIVEHVQLSRRALEIRFRKALGCTIHSKIEHVRLERAKRLLLESNLPMPKVAESAGFNTASYFAQVFRRKMGVTPAGYRANMHLR
jgi:LacI family transcriptional regulator